MVKRRVEELIAGALEFPGRTKDDAEVLAWVAEHKARNGGKLRFSIGGTGMRVIFSKEADLQLWKTRLNDGAKAKRGNAA